MARPLRIQRSNGRYHVTARGNERRGIYRTDRGRFKALIIEQDGDWQEVARYVHLNPVRVSAMKLDKRSRSAARIGLGAPPSAKLLAERLGLLRSYLRNGNS